MNGLNPAMELDLAIWKKALAEDENWQGLGADLQAIFGNLGDIGFRAGWQARDQAEKPLTVREAFAKAGHPVPADANIIRYENGTWIWGNIATCELCGWHKGVWDNPDRDPNLFCAVFEVGSIDLSNLPASDCLDALPDVVKAVVL